jgi:hypothetical protein
VAGARTTWFLEQGRWSWLRVWAALLEVLTMLFNPAVWYAVIDDSVVERVSTEAPGSLMHHNHTAKPNRPKFLRGQGWLCLAAVIERNDFAVGAVPLLLRLVRRGTNRGKLRSAGLLLRLLGQRLGQVRRLLDAWFRRAWLIHRALAAGHTVIGCVRRDLALFEVPKAPRQRRQGRPAKDGARLTPDRVAALPEQRSAEILYGKLAVVRYRTGRVAARFLHGRVVRAVWVDLERPDRRDKPRVQRLLICTDPALSALAVISGYAKRWAVESLFRNLKHGFGLKDAWQQSRQALMRWVTLLAVSYAINQMLAFTDPAGLAGLAEPAPWRAPGSRTGGLIQAGIARILRAVGRPAFIAAIWGKIGATVPGTGGSSVPLAAKAA